MKWKTIAPNAPKDGDVRTVRRFAWLPIAVGDYTVWLEVVQIEQVYAAADYRFSDPDNYSSSYCGKWKNKTVHLLDCHF